MGSPPEIRPQEASAILGRTEVFRAMLAQHWPSGSAPSSEAKSNDSQTATPEPPAKRQRRSIRSTSDPSAGPSSKMEVDTAAEESKQNNSLPSQQERIVDVQVAP